MLTDEEKTQLVQAAMTAQKGAYAPYSHYLVGAALLTRDNQIITGCNVENAAYPAAICAERTAVVKAVSEGHRFFQAVAVVTENAGTPCGECRQVLSEFNVDMTVIIADATGKIIQEMPLNAYLPYSFSPDKLPDES